MLQLELWEKNVADRNFGSSLIALKDVWARDLDHGRRATAERNVSIVKVRRGKDPLSDNVEVHNLRVTIEIYTATDVNNLEF